MTSIGGTIYTRLTTHAGTTALVSTRVYPNKIPQNATYPAIVYESNNRDQFHAMGADADTVQLGYQVTIYAATYSEVRSVTDQVILALSRWSSAGDSVQDTLLRGENDFYNDEVELHGVALDFDFFIST